MRGKLVKKTGILKSSGITPAHAGKTRFQGSSNHPKGDHPRACGENTFRHSPCLSHWGSPPRMRGKPVLGGKAPARVGITPAHAGKTARTARPSTRRRDHPRACGENAQPQLNSSFQAGSPPRMRGKRIKLCDQRRYLGITPAHAGKT